MKKRRAFNVVKIILFIIAILVFINEFVFSFSFYKQDEIKKEAEQRELEKFQLYKTDFESVNEFICSMPVTGSNSFSIIYKNNVITSLYDGRDIPLPNEIKTSLNTIDDNLFYMDFSFIDVTEYRISYGGLGNIMYVFSRNGEIPDYFYHEEDNIDYTTYVLTENWYKLVNVAR